MCRRCCAVLETIGEKQKEDLEEIIGTPSGKTCDGVDAPATGLIALLEDLKKVLNTFGQSGWIKRAVQLSKHTKTLRKLDKKIRDQVRVSVEWDPPQTTLLALC